jgi:hypothetical protein
MDRLDRKGKQLKTDGIGDWDRWVPANGGVQRRAVESEIMLGTKSVSKMPLVSWREARPLQRDGRPAR